MDKKIILTVMLMVLVIATGCTSSSKKKENPFVGGTNGVLINFMESAPPDEVFDGGGFPFNVIVKLSNEGEYTVPQNNIKLWLIGIDPAEFGLRASDFVKQPTEDLIKVSRDDSGNKIPSIPVEIEFPEFNYLGKVSGEVTYNIIAKICYNYQTLANAKLCIKNNLLDSSATVCKLSEDKPVYSSGAPIQVTSFKQSISGKDKISFEFTVEQKGNGNVFRNGMECNDIFANRDKVFVSIDSGIPGLMCTGFTGGNFGFITIFEGKRTVSCIQQIDITEQKAYEKQLTITLNYDYMEMKSKPILIKKSG